ncbi:MAG: hypothetical protein WBQ23_17035 [Bacteroidota bacterium]
MKTAIQPPDQFCYIAPLYQRRWKYEFRLTMHVLSLEKLLPK